MHDEAPGDESRDQSPSSPETGAHRAPRTPRQRVVAWLRPVAAAVVLLVVASTIVWPKLSSPTRRTTSEGVTTASHSLPPSPTAPRTTNTQPRRPPVAYEVVTGQIIKVDRHWQALQLRKKVQEKSGKRKRHKKAADALPPLTFRIASLNVLGASHTSRSGNKPSYRDEAARMGIVVGVLRSQGVDVVGFQELESSQFSAFRNRMGSGWSVYPGMSLGTRGVRNSVAWNTSVWQAVETHTTTIPYFHGNRVLIPYVKLRNPATGREAWFISVHNPTSNARRGNNQRWRNIATNIERNLMMRLHADGTPVFLSGDFNERNEAFCKMTVGSRLQSASGGSGGPPCLLPPNLGIDWIFSSPDVAFSNYLRYQTPYEQRATDHPLVRADATLSGE